MFFRKLALSALAIVMSASVLAQPSAAQLEQFKQLPRAQQEALAKQYGIDVSQLGSGASPGRLQEANVEPLQQDRQVTPARPTRPAGLQRFGDSLFDGNISTFAPVANVPVPDNYRLGPDDTLLLQLYGKQNNDYELVISRDGNINLPDLGPLNVSGLTFSQASSLIRNRLTESNIGLQAAVTMGQLRTINIFVAGEARNPGMYAVSALTSVTQALFVSGGVSDIGSLRDIRVTRAGNTVATFDLYQLLLKGNNANDITLQHGDVLFISPIGSVVSIEGEVRRPAHYELMQGENLATLVTMAGGLQPAALTHAIALERATPAGRERINVNFSLPAQQNLLLKAGDKVVVPQLSTRVRQQVTVVGAVSRPGHYAWTPGLQLHQLLTDIWSDLLATTDADYALLVRKINPRGDIEVTQFNLLQALTSDTNQVQQPISLQPQDIVLVFNQGNQTYQREQLNRFIRTEVQQQLSQFDNNALLAGDIAAANFEKLENRNSIIASSQFNGQERSLSSAVLVENYIDGMLKQLYSNSATLNYSKHLSRREILYPLLQQLRSQSSNLQDIPVVSISGDVKVPGEYPLPRNGNVSMLVQAAGGYNSSAFLNRAELSRFVGQQVEQNGITQQNININLAAIVNGEQPDLRLVSRDRLNVFATPDWSQVRLVNLHGEIRFPGTYQVLKGETLSDVINRAGGFNSNAYPYGAVFTRANIKRREQEQAARLLEQLKADIASKALTNNSSMMASGANAAPNALIQELQTIEPVGRLVIDLESIMIGHSGVDFEVENGDTLYVPRQQTSVTIMGEVQHPGSHRFRTGLTVSDYLTLTGGARKRADDKRVFVIRADGSVMIPAQNRWFNAVNDQLRPGDTIIMPLDTEYKDSLSTWAQVTQIFYQTAVAIAALNSF